MKITNENKVLALFIFPIILIDIDFILKLSLFASLTDGYERWVEIYLNVLRFTLFLIVVLISYFLLSKYSLIIKSIILLILTVHFICYLGIFLGWLFGSGL